MISLAGLGVALGLTQLVELPVAAALGLRSGRSLLRLAAANLASNPMLNLCLLACWALVPAARVGGVALLVVAVAEALVVVGEAAWVTKGEWGPAGLAVVAANCTSAAVGLALLWT